MGGEWDVVWSGVSWNCRDVVKNGQECWMPKVKMKRKCLGSLSSGPFYALNSEERYSTLLAIWCAAVIPTNDSNLYSLLPYHTSATVKNDQKQDTKVL